MRYVVLLIALGRGAEGIFRLLTVAQTRNYCILWYSKVRNHVHKTPVLVSILSQMNPIHTLIVFSTNIQVSQEVTTLQVYELNSVRTSLTCVLRDPPNSPCSFRHPNTI